MTSTRSRHGLMSTYPEQRVTFVTSSGTELFDENGKRYLDFLSGLAVTSLGHAHPAVAEAISDQAGKLVHVSNLFGTLPGRDLSAMIDELLGSGGQVFFSNSGAEANEAAIKLARKWGGPGRHVILSADRSFHGRTLATLHATGQPEKHAPFQPLPPGFRHFAWNDLDSLQDHLADDVVAVLVEPLQGEGGVRPADPDFMFGLERICRANRVLLILDEIQTGLGRTGEWFGFQHFGISPDMVTLAKALGNGMPIGATWAKSPVAASFQPGDHGSTFGGQPLATAAALRVLNVMRAIDAPARARASGTRLVSGLEAVAAVARVRGMGLLLAAELRSIPAPEIAAGCLDAGLVVNAVTPTAIRFAPPLTVSDEEIDEAIGLFSEVCNATSA